MNNTDKAVVNTSDDGPKNISPSDRSKLQEIDAVLDDASISLPTAIAKARRILNGGTARQPKRGASK